jgi:alkanesulfonate monooxygenase SsuD/methylene tetrahydromethanopterin reductase-like flavin-dependent oxidoreductase (luciferase family)
MRVLLDEDIPRPVRRILVGHDVRTTQQMGWAGYANGRLLQAAERAGFDVVITGDQNFVLQQNLTGLIVCFPYRERRRPLRGAQP